MGDVDWPSSTSANRIHTAVKDAVGRQKVAEAVASHTATAHNCNAGDSGLGDGIWPSSRRAE